MNESIEIQTLAKIKKQEGVAFFIDNFLTMTNADAVRKALERLVMKGEITI